MVLLGYCGIVGVLFYGRFPCLGSGVDHSRSPRSCLLLWWRQRRVPHRSEGTGQYCAVGIRLASYPKSLCAQLLTGRSSFANAFFTGLFLWPVVRNSLQDDRVSRIAVRTMWSALVGLTTSCVNILVLTLMHGRQLGWVYLVSCGADVS